MNTSSYFGAAAAAAPLSFTTTTTATTSSSNLSRGIPLIKDKNEEMEVCCKSSTSCLSLSPTTSASTRPDFVETLEEHEMKRVFFVMERRRLTRSLQGYKRDSGSLRTWVEIVVALVVFIWISNLMSKSLILIIWPSLSNLTPEERFDRTSFVPAIVSFVAVVWMIICITAFLKPVIHTMALTTFFCGIVWGVWAYDPEDTTRWDGLSSRETTIVAVIICIELALFVAYLVVHFGYPFMIGHMRPDWLLVHWFRMRRDDQDSNYYCYKRYGPFSIARNKCRFTGHVDEAGLPNGLGMWMDDSAHGELLRGMWIRGRPTSPFVSREFGSGSMFMSRKIFWASTRKEKGLHDKLWFPARDPQGLRCGIANVEASASGSFFSHLPKVRQLVGASYYVEDMLRKYKGDDPDFRELSAEALNGMESPGLAPHLNIRVARDTDMWRISDALKRDNISKEFLSTTRKDDDDTIDDDNNDDSLHPHAPAALEEDGVRRVLRLRHTATGYAELGKKDTLRRSLSQDCPPVSLPVHIVGGQPLVAQSSLPEALLKELADPAPEALIYLHGYNCKISSAMERLGQLMALGQFPLYIKPFIFSQSMALTYHWAMWSLPVFAGDLSDIVLSSERQASYGSISLFIRWELDLMIMVRLFCEALPEMERRSFLRIRARVPGTITCIHDAALSPSSSSSLSTHNGGEPQEMISLQRKQTDFGAPFSEDDDLCCDLEAGGGCDTRRMLLSSVIFVNADYPLDHFNEQILPQLLEYCQRVSVYADLKDGALIWAELFNNEKALGKHPEAISCVDPLTGRRYGQDYVDVMDTTHMDQNVHDLRHNFFNLNVQVVSDIADIIRTGTPAEQRYTRLTRTGHGNVFTFLSPPSFVKSC
ncbi:hypothetical protein Pmar_PMAR009721 [Perkinsus marinus ATCC 50983]|uniref:Uncharacterized protein n=1 Tax=Perkinsus marinus (strain ATCC 50983 / TXsc) TaxID=423536 RepID=C5L231_PERM5|nr:hypothetical protein Pmar_PMAR009721 [Perkinsus marinus ATCC 50983]EER09224.1 hypothetical protein Pmar_PMAR009721 [Perkinsus marinus ATCC 50983]|eukprot:XP_002777408.1 hypothetical protein Pmar_PMAR009721 [Perkinsus marinus ATCC 50983]